MAPPQEATLFDFTDVSDGEFWERVEDLILEALKSYADPTKNAFYSALFQRMTGMMGAQANARTNAPTPARPETAGLATPSASPAPPSSPPDMAEKVEKMSWQESGEEFVKEVLAVQARSGLK